MWRNSGLWTRRSRAAICFVYTNYICLSIRINIFSLTELLVRNISCFTKSRNRRGTSSTSIGIERNDNSSLTPAAFDLDSARHKPGKQTAAVAPQGIVTTLCLRVARTFGTLISHYARAFFRSCPSQIEVAMKAQTNKPCTVSVSIVG